MKTLREFADALHDLSLSVQGYESAPAPLNVDWSQRSKKPIKVTWATLLDVEHASTSLLQLSHLHLQLQMSFSIVYRELPVEIPGRALDDGVA